MKKAAHAGGAWAAWGDEMTMMKSYDELIATGDHAANLRGLEPLLEDLTLADPATRIVMAAADEIDRLKADLAAERARLDWIEAGGDTWGSDGSWGATMPAADGTRSWDFSAGSLREAIDIARGEAVVTSPARTSP